MFVSGHEESRTNDCVDLLLLKVGIYLFLCFLVLVNAEEVIFGVHLLQGKQFLCETR